MLNRWLDPLEWDRVRPWLLALGSLMMAGFQVEDIRTNDGWWVVLDWLTLGFFGVAAAQFVREGLRTERAARRPPDTEGTV